MSLSYLEVKAVCGNPEYSYLLRLGVQTLIHGMLNDWHYWNQHFHPFSHLH